MAEQKSLVQNAGDPEQVDKAKKTLALRRDQEMADWNDVFNTPAGIRVLDRIMAERCKTFESIWSQSAAIHYNAGQQDIGHWFMAESVEANPEIMFKIMMNRKKEIKNG